MARRLLSILILILGSGSVAGAQGPYLGFDRNVYPGDAALAALRKTFVYTGYWLNTPPEARRNSWTGKRAILKAHGFGFLVLFNGRLDAALKGRNAAALGRADGKAAAAAAAREGFARDVLIFLDQEEGGRLLAEQVAYLFAWVDAVRAAGDRAGVYCSGIDVKDEDGTIDTARQIAELELSRAHSQPKDKSADRLAVWVANDQCPPSPGCTVERPRMDSGFVDSAAAYAPVWQYAQSPRRMEFSAACPHNAAADGNCYAPDLPRGANSFIDLNAADSPDPSE